MPNLPNLPAFTLDSAHRSVAAAKVRCRRAYLEAVLYESSIRLLRISMAETSRFPEGAAKHHDVVFTEVTSCVSSYLKASFGVSARASSEAAQRLKAVRRAVAEVLATLPVVNRSDSSA